MNWRVYDRIIREALPFVLLTTLAEIGAGAILTDIRELYNLLPGLLLVIPGLMELRGNIATGLAQRLGSAVHIGVVGWDQGFNQELSANMKASVLLSGMVSVLLGIGAYCLTLVTQTESMGFVIMMFITVGVAVCSGVVQAFLTSGVALYAAHRGVDPDNVTIPILATIGDILSVVFILLVAHSALILQLR